MQDGMTSERFSVDQLNVGSAIASVVLSGADLAVGTSTIAETELGIDSVGTKAQGFVGIGSPPAYVSRILHGSTAISAATSDWVLFGQKFGAVPDIVLGTNVAATWTGATTGSFLLSGANATIVSWLAIGSA